MRDYLWHRKDRANEEGIYIIDEVLGTEERKRRWDVKGK